MSELLQTQPSKVYIDSQSHRRLKEIAQVQRRTLGGQLEFLIDEAYRAHVSSTQQAPQPAATEV